MTGSLSILFVDPADGQLYLPSLRRRFDVSVASTRSEAIDALRTARPALILTELTLPDGSGAELCRHAKMYAERPWVLGMTSDPALVPETLLAGCDGVLMKPFAPTLLFTRIGRALRHRAEALAANGDGAAAAPPRAPTMNVVSPETCCPSCGQGNAVSFDATSYRRAWFACLPCRHVWIGKSDAA